MGSGGLMNWAVNLALDEIERRDNLDDWPSIRAAAYQAQNKPAKVGNAVHQAVDNFNRNLPLELTDVTAPFVAHYASALRREGIAVLSSERYVVNVAVGFGGTYDSLVEIDGELGPLDVKTGKEKQSQRLQLTGLSMGEWHGEAGLEPEPMPSMSGVGWILLLRADGYQLIRHDITEADREHFARLVETYHRIRQWQEAA
jgi:RecB family exonuclease